MRDEDEAFADIIHQEFDEQWTPPRASAPAVPPVDPGPPPDFHLNLYDDDESYREVPPHAWSLSATTLAGLGLVGFGLVITIAKILPLHLPSWLGWVGVASFVAGTAVSLWHLTHTPHEQDDDGTV
jgi:hypothetical protein